MIIDDLKAYEKEFNDFWSGFFCLSCSFAAGIDQKGKASKALKFTTNGLYYQFNKDEARDAYNYWFVTNMVSSQGPEKILKLFNIQNDDSVVDKSIRPFYGSIMTNEFIYVPMLTEAFT